MSYTALYRKYRPKTFTDVVGQDHIVITLQNQIKSGKQGHAYLLCGTRGTGKTTVAKIFAKAVNCDNPAEGNPCEECDTCISIADGSSLNVIEIDAASNNGVDNIRQIREEVAYRPTRGQYKVYIIDEVHMLSMAAENALLKTLEEPPSYVIFILATTDKHKIAPTILSRCQQYDFKRMKIETIANRMKELLGSEGVVGSEKAIRYIAKTADGSMRDALSLLDQCIGFRMGEELSLDSVLEILGSVEIEVFSRLLEGILRRDVAKVMALIEEIVMEGSELTSFVSDFTWYLRNLLLLKTSDNMVGEHSSNRVEETLDVTSEDIVALREEARKIELEVLLRFIRITSELLEQLRFTTGKRVAVEVAFIKLCIPAMEVDVDSVLERIRVIEDKLEAGVIIDEKSLGAAKGSRAKEPETMGKVLGERAVRESPSEGRALEERATVGNVDIGEDKKDISWMAKEFPGWIQSLSPVLGMYFSDINSYRISQEGDRILKIVHNNETAYSLLNTPEKKEEIKQLIRENTQEEIEVRVERYNKKEDIQKSQEIDNIIQENIKFTITKE